MFFKALANADRIKIAGLLGVEPLSVTGLAERLHMKPMVVANHLEHLEALEMVRSEAGIYRLNVAAIEALPRRVLAGRHPQVKPEDFDGEAFERNEPKNALLSEAKHLDHQFQTLQSQKTLLQGDIEVGSLGIAVENGIYGGCWRAKPANNPHI